MSRRFAWAPVNGADGYHVELFLGARRVFATDSTEPTLTVPARWKYDGKQHRLRAGEYQWYVWPIVSGVRGTNAVVQAKLLIPTA